MKKINELVIKYIGMKPAEEQKRIDNLTKFFEATGLPDSKFECVSENSDFQWATLLYLVREENRAEIAKQNGTTKRLKALQAILKDAPDDRHYLKFAPIIDGSQYVCDSYSLVKLNSPLDLPAPPDNIEKIDYSKLIERNRPNSRSVEITARINPIDLKQKIAEIKATTKGNKGVHLPTVRIELENGERVYVNAKFLVRMLDIFPTAKITVSTRRSPICFESDDGYGFICPTSKIADEKVIIKI